MNNARVHILLPTYEPDPEHLRAAVQSLLRQTSSDWKLTINDDASKKDVKAMIAEFLSDPRITFQKNEKNLGIGGNWNACVKQIDTPYAQFLFQDDLWEPNYLEKMMRVLDGDSEIGLVAANHRYLFEGDIDRTPYENTQTARELYMKEEKMNGVQFLLWWTGLGLHPNIIGEPSFVMMRASVMKNIGMFDASMVQLLDEDYWTRALLVTDISYVTEPLGDFRVHGAGASARHASASLGMFDRLRMLHKINKLLPQEHEAKMNDGLNRACYFFVQKFIERKNTTSQQKKNGMLSALLLFMIRHPIMTIDCGFRWMRGRKKFATGD